MATAIALAEQLTTIGLLLRAEPVEIQTRTTATVWPMLVSRFGSPLNALRFMRQEHRPFFDVVGAHLPLELLEDAIARMDATRADDLSVLVVLPERLRRCALRAVAQLTTSTDHPIWRLDEVVSALDTDDIELLVEFSAEKYTVGRAAAERVWSLDAERALLEAVKSLSKKADSAAWFLTAPSEHFDALLDSLGTLKHPPLWGTRWLAKILSRAGAQAPRVFEMLAQLSRRTSR